MVKKYTYDEVKKFFEDAGCQLLSKDYKDNKAPLEYICECKEKAMTNLNHFKNGHRCKICGNYKSRIKITYNYDYIKKQFESRGCILISTSYKNAFDKLDYICSCGTKSSIQYNNFQQGQKCMNCGIESQKHTYEYVKNKFDEEGCELLSDKYINADSKLKYKCICGNIAEIMYKSFQEGHKCGCQNSISESNTVKFFDKFNIKYKRQKFFPDCKNIRPLPFDFFVEDKYIIETDGGQHFKPVEIFGGEEQFKKQVLRDNIKNEYCIKNKIPILRISFKELKKIDKIILKYFEIMKEKNYDIVFTNENLYKNMANEIKKYNDNYYILDINKF